jgi:Ethylbenzene dehydrogenase/Carbohydrate family 9 binding domain-like
MKLFQKRYIWVTATIVLAIGYFVSCTKDDQVLDVPVALNGTELFSEKISSAPAIDGTIDAMWDNAAKLSVDPSMPDPGNGMWAGYQGTIPTTIRSMYDNQYIYFLVEVKDADKSHNVSPWYFDPVTKLWNREPGARLLDANGALLREGFGKDQLSFLWNIDNSTPKFASQTCYASCHIFTPYMDYSVNPPVMKSNAGSGNHYTNNQNEKIDMWWLHPQRGLVFGNMDDNYQDWAGGPAITNLVGGNANGRHFDDLVPNGTASTTWPYRPNYTADATQGSANNTQNLKLDGTGATVTVPLWIVPNSTSGYIKVADTLAGGAGVKITAVSSTGVLSYNGGSIDPNAGTDYQRLGNTATSPIGPKCFLSVILFSVKNGRADITSAAVHTGTGWIYEFKRLLKTADVLKQDIDFSSLDDQPFGVAVFDKSNYQHAIKPNLVLKFKK